jgi:MoaA/NifB/PqqE/SkfB family radical SAM enzyme
MTALTDQLAEGLNSPICLTWEWTYACDLACVHCLSSSGRRDPNELSTEQMKAVVDQLAEMQVFYVNIGGGEPMLRPDFFEIVDEIAEAQAYAKSNSVTMDAVNMALTVTDDTGTNNTTAAQDANARQLRLTA